MASNYWLALFRALSILPFSARSTFEQSRAVWGRIRAPSDSFVRSGASHETTRNARNCTKAPEAARNCSK
eukprot:5445612-Alexandrium_andersonii.AAC.1